MLLQSGGRGVHLARRREGCGSNRAKAGWMAGLLGIGALFVAAPAMAQVQRLFNNLSFETPNLVTPGCRVYIAASQVPGWNTTHPNATTQNVGSCVVPAGFNQTAPILELWRTPRDNASGGVVNARSGNQIAELNADTASRIYQNICLINGERVIWRFSHRGRGSATTPDQAELKVGASATVVRVGTTNNGAFTTPVVSQGTANTPVNAPGNATWVDYAGQFTYAGATGNTNIGFEAIGGTTSGNLLDDIQIELAPFLEYTQPSSSSPEATGGNLPRLRVNGTVTASFTVTIDITGGTATRGVDYHTPGDAASFNMTIPVGNYDGGAGSEFVLPVTIVNDAASESNETIVFGIVAPLPPNPPFLLASSNTCGGSVQTVWTYTISDDDAGISLSKNAAAPVPVAGDAAQFDIVYTIVANNPSSVTTANYALTDTPGFDANVAIVSASFTRNGGAATALAGSGPWTLQPQWRALAPGATDTYLVSVRGRVNRGGTTANDGCTNPTAGGNGLHNRADATVQASGGNPATTFNAASCRNTPTPAWARLDKQLTARAAASDQAQIRLFSAGLATATAVTTGSAAPATATTNLLVLPAGNTMQFDEAIKPNGTGLDELPVNYQTGIACTNANAGSGTALPTGAGTPVGARQQWAEFTPAAGDDIVCTITNTPIPIDLSISKTNTPASGPNDQASDTVTGGVPTTYDIVVRNNGAVATSFGATLRDPATASLGSCQLGTPSCAVTGSGTCPTVGGGAGQLSVANLQGAGVLIPVLGPGAAMTFKLTCTPQ